MKPNSIVPTVMEFVDIAGLVAGASKGEGLGNQFLANIRSTDATLHIVRCFEDPEVIHVAGKVDPAVRHRRDQYRAAAGRPGHGRRSAIEKVQKLARTSQDSKVKNEFSALTKLREALNAGKPARTADLTDEERPLTRDLFLITMKPTLYVANVDEAGLTDGNAHTAAVEKRAKEEGSEVV